jgi:predicted RNase H-like HicB family nuclease
MEHKKEQMSELAKYLELPYTVTLRRDDEGDFIARVQELRGCSAHGKTPQDALENLDEAKSLWIQDCLENGNPVPLPEEAALPSGKWLQRVPRKLHRKLQILSEKEGVSFNQFVTALLAEAVGELKVAKGEPIPAQLHGIVMGGVEDEYFVNQSYELVPPSWQVINVTGGVEQISGIQVLNALKRWSSQLPNKSVGKLKEKKHAKEEHTPFEIC